MAEYVLRRYLCRHVLIDDYATLNSVPGNPISINGTMATYGVPCPSCQAWRDMGSGVGHPLPDVATFLGLRGMQCDVGLPEILTAAGRTMVTEMLASARGIDYAGATGVDARGDWRGDGDENTRENEGGPAAEEDIEFMSIGDWIHSDRFADSPSPADADVQSPGSDVASDATELLAETITRTAATQDEEPLPTREEVDSLRAVRRHQGRPRRHGPLSPPLAPLFRPPLRRSERVRRRALQERARERAARRARTGAPLRRSERLKNRPLKRYTA
jgi:hypothetical protein